MSLHAPHHYDGDGMRSRIFTLQNPSGLHARPATAFVQIASTLSSTVKVENLDRQGTAADGKSIIEILTLGAGPGHRIQVQVDGPNEDRDIEALAAAIESGLGESAQQHG